VAEEAWAPQRAPRMICISGETPNIAALEAGHIIGGLVVLILPPHWVTHPDGVRRTV